MRGAQSGLGLVDTLMALVLLALSLLGACTLLVRSQAASRAATLQTAAVDLATDLAEDLRAGSASPREVIAIPSWRGRVAEALPIGTPPLDPYANVTPTAVLPDGGVRGLDVTLRWWDPAIHRPTTLTLRLAEGWPESTP